MIVFGVLFSFYSPHHRHHHHQRSANLARAMNTKGKRDSDSNGGWVSVVSGPISSTLGRFFDGIEPNLKLYKMVC